MSVLQRFWQRNQRSDTLESRLGTNISIRFKFDSIRTRGPAHLITLNYTLLFMENYKSNCTRLGQWNKICNFPWITNIYHSTIVGQTWSGYPLKFNIIVLIKVNWFFFVENANNWNATHFWILVYTTWLHLITLFTLNYTY